MKKYVLFMILALTMVVGRVQAQSTEQKFVP